MSAAPEHAGTPLSADAGARQSSGTEPHERAMAALRQVGFLSALDAATLADVAAIAEPRRYASGARIIGELEFGADVFVIVRGEAEVSVDAKTGERRVLGRLGPGGACGEMSSLTGDLRSATVTAISDVEVLVIDDDDFDRLRERRPEIAMALLRTLADRLGEAERSIEQVLSERPGSGAVHAAAAAAGGPRRGSIRRAWRELVVGKRRDLAFLALAGFVVTLLAVRLAVYVAFRVDVAPRGVLRGAYMTGFGLLVGSAGGSLLRFGPVWRRAIALGYGIGLALIANELGVTLAFDIFYRDIHTPDPNVPFDIERLYRRTEPIRAIAVGLVVLVQAAYLRPFYRRAGFVLKTRLRRLRGSR